MKMRDILFRLIVIAIILVMILASFVALFI
mgnify:CR=1 FL=1